LFQYKTIEFCNVLVLLRVFEVGQNAPEICLSEMRQIITTALQTIFGEVRALMLILLVFLNLDFGI